MPPKKKSTRAAAKTADPDSNGTTAPKISKKRAADKNDGDVQDAAPPAKKVKDSQQLKSRSITVPVDEGVPDSANFTVHVAADDSLVYDVTLNQTNSTNNNNKFYRLQLLKHHTGTFWTWTRWGRVGEHGQTKWACSDTSFDEALKEFQKKFKDKNGNKWENRNDPVKSGKYEFIERNYESMSDDDDLPGAGKRRESQESVKTEESEEKVESKLPSAVQRLMGLIFNQDYFQATFVELEYDAYKMPLGKLSKATLLKGYEVLKELAAIIGDHSLADGPLQPALEQRSNRYFSLIPHAFGRNRPPVLRDINMVKKEVDLLEALTDMALGNEIMKAAKGNKDTKENSLDKQYSGLNLDEMTPLDPDSTEYRELAAYLTKSSGATHNFSYKIQDIFRIPRQGEQARFTDSHYSKIPADKSEKRLLWHGQSTPHGVHATYFSGSRCTNFGGILSQGLRIAPPEAPVSGYMFGKGVYFADMSSKSAGYTASYTTGNIGLLLLCEVELGKPPLKLTSSDYNAADRVKEAGCLSTLGVGGTAPATWKDAGVVRHELKGTLMPDVERSMGPTEEKGAGLLYNEYIVYDVKQIRMRYLFRVDMG